MLTVAFLAFNHSFGLMFIFFGRCAAPRQFGAVTPTQPKFPEGEVKGSQEGFQCLSQFGAVTPAQPNSFGLMFFFFGAPLPNQLPMTSSSSFKAAAVAAASQSPCHACTCFVAGALKEASFVA